MAGAHPLPDLQTRSLSFTHTQDSSSSSSAPQAHRLETPASAGGATPTTRKKILVHRDIQAEEHFRELLEQGKLRHGSIIKKRDQRRRGSTGENVVLSMDGQVAGRLPRSTSIGSLSARSQSEDVSQSSVSIPNALDSLGDTRSTAATAATATSPFTPSYTVRERGQFDEFWVIIVNGLKKKEWEARCGRLLSQISLVRWKVYLTRYPGHAKKLAMRAQNKGADMIIAVGGDGTLDEVVDGMLRSHCLDEQGVPKAVLSVLPLGRANDFHRSMGWDPDSFEDGLWRIGRGYTALIDVGKVTCIGSDGAPMARCFLNEASVGSNAKVCGRLENYGVFGKLRHTVASVVETWKHIVFKPRVDVVVSYDDGEWTHVKNLTLLAACNGCSFARGKKLSTSANPYTGCLDMVTVSSTRTLFSVSRVFQRMGEGTPSRSRHISSHICSTVDVLPSDRRGNPLVGTGPASGADIARQSSTGSMTGLESEASQSSLAGNSELEAGSHRVAHVPQSTPKKAVQRAQIKRLLAKATHPIEVGGTVVGELPATFTVLPNALKIRISDEPISRPSVHSM